MPKKKVFVVWNLKDCYQIYHSDQEKQKRKLKFFYRDNFVFPWRFVPKIWTGTYLFSSVIFACRSACRLHTRPFVPSAAADAAPPVKSCRNLFRGPRRWAVPPGGPAPCGGGTQSIKQGATAGRIPSAPPSRSGVSGLVQVYLDDSFHEELSVFYTINTLEREREPRRESRPPPWTAKARVKREVVYYEAIKRELTSSAAPILLAQKS
jgi:hypothetical protein